MEEERIRDGLILQDWQEIRQVRTGKAPQGEVDISNQQKEDEVLELSTGIDTVTSNGGIQEPPVSGQNRGQGSPQSSIQGSHGRNVAKVGSTLPGREQRCDSRDLGAEAVSVSAIESRGAKAGNATVNATMQSADPAPPHRETQGVISGKEL